MGSGTFFVFDFIRMIWGIYLAQIPAGRSRLQKGCVKQAEAGNWPRPRALIKGDRLG